jgi:hypothetical protein
MVKRKKVRAIIKNEKEKELIKKRNWRGNNAGKGEES